MKLLVVSHACITSVNQAFFAEVSHATGWDVSLLVPQEWTTDYKAGNKVERLEGFSGGLYSIPVWKPGNIPLHVYKSALIGLLRKVNPDAIYVHHEPYGLATFQVYIANRLSTRVPIGVYAAQNILKQYPAPFRWFERYVLAQSKFAFPVSQGALEILRKKGYSAPADVLPLAVDPEVYRRRPDWAAGERTALGIGKDEFVIGYVGRLVEEKGLATLFKALARLNGFGWRCVLVGSGAYEPALRTLATELDIADRILFCGYVEHHEAPSWFSLFDLFVLPSETRRNWKEQFGRVIVEANACEVPVVGTESGEIGNVLRATGGGLVVPEAEPATLADAIGTLMGDPAQCRLLAQRGAEAVRAKFGQRQLALQFADRIREACLSG